MKHLKSFNESDLLPTWPSSQKVIDGIRECFYGVSDLLPETTNSGIRVKTVDFSKSKFIKNNELKGVGYEVMIIPKVLGELYQKKYRPSTCDSELIDEIENSTSLCKTLGLELESGTIEWVKNNGEIGPGMMSKKFRKGGSDPSDEKIIKGSYDLNYLFDFTREKGDKIRWVRLFFSKTLS